jgi:unsaturated rhamnogalacturonyl hydrolase
MEESFMKLSKRILAFVLALVMVIGMVPAHAFAAEADATLTASLAKAKAYIDGITINNSSNDPATVVKNFKTHFTWDNEKRENSKSYLFDWSYYNGVVFEGIEYVYEVTGESVYKDYVVEYMSSMITAAGGWATCSNNSSKQAAGYNSTHGADCYKTASLLVDCYRMTGDQRYLTMAATLYADLDKAAGSYLLKNAGNNYRHTWASDPSPDLWLDGLYMILPFRAEYAKYIGDTEELNLIVSRMQWVSDNMYNSSKKLFYHAADSASSNSGTYWLRSIGWYAAAIVDIMDHMSGSNLETMKVQLKKLVDGMRACQNSSNGMWLNNMNAAQSSSNPYETSGTALVCYAVMKAVNNGWLDESYADMAILAFNGICREKLSGSTLKDICFKGVPSGSNSTFYDNEGKGVGPFIMLYAELLEYVNKAEEEPKPTEPVPTEPEVTEPEVTEPEVTEPEATEPEATEPTEPSEPEEELPVYTGTSNLVGNVVYTLDSDGINSGEKYLIVYSGKALQNNNGVDKNPAVTVSNNTITLADDSTLAWTITLSSGNNYYVENNGSYINLSASGNDPIGSSKTVYITRSSSKYTFRNASGSGAYLRYSSSQLFCAGTSSSNNGMSLYRRTSTGNGDQVIFTLSPSASMVKPGSTLVLNGTVTVAGKNVDLNSCTITWSSADNGIATVSNGTVTGVATGKTTITVTLTAANGKDLKNAIVLTVPVTVQGHDYKAVVTAPTCTEAGFTTYTCTICGESYVADRVTALGHDHKAVVTAPTCETAGYTTYTCHCGDAYVSDEVAALGHTYESVTTAPTCTVNGSTVYTCHCGDSYVETIAALGHTYESVTTAPTCTDKGYTTHTCHCGDHYVDSYIEATGHSYSCVEQNGFLIYTCDVCGDSYSESVAWIALPKVYKLDTNGIDVGAEHKYIVVGADKNYALTVSGTTVGSAAVTVKDNTITLDNAANYEFYFVNNNSKERGSYLLTKDGSKYVYHMGGNMYYGTDNKGYWHFGSSSNGSYQLYDNDNLKWYLNYGYVWGSDSVSRFAVSSTARYVRLFKATETFARLSGEGFQTYAHEAGATLDTVLNKLVIQLSDNGSSVSGTLAVTSDLVTWDKSFDGITAGTYTGTVTYQGVVLGSVTVTITGEHTYETVTTEATCTTAGESVHTCTACGHSYRDNVTTALGHSYSCEESNGYYVYTCDRCGDSYSEKMISYTQVNAISAGKDYVITLYSGNKYYAVSHANNQISVVQVTVSNGEITSEITEDLLWTYSGNKLSYVSNGTTYYMYCYTNSWWGGWWGNTGTSLQLSTSNSSTVSFSGNKLKVGSYYLRYSNGSVNLNSSATTAYIFVEG